MQSKLTPPDMQASLQRLLAETAGARSVLVCTHDNPDPDSIASGYALCRLFEVHGNRKCVLVHGGVLGRAENRAMVELLRIPLVPFSSVNIDDFDVVGLVDTQPVHHNHVLQPDVLKQKPLICLDHHPVVPGPPMLWSDLGGRYGATSTLATCYLHAGGVPLDGSLATALFYGIKSDTRDLGREVHDVDIWAYTTLIARTDMSVISRIEHPPQPRPYFAAMARAFHDAQSFDDVAMVDMGDVYVPEVIAEVADALQSAEGVRWAMAVGSHGDHVYASVRVNGSGLSAGTLMTNIIVEFPTGNAGGHSSMAGCRVRMPPGHDAAARQQTRIRLQQAMLRGVGVSHATPRAFCAS
jgi:nanoRNase/pAp phosphatase (c-di-AMP/oligoRNAs hydrolase)